MVLFNYSTKELTAKIVYYGPGLCGKTTNLQFIHGNLPGNVKGKMLSLATKTDRTLFFDFLPIDLGEIRGMKTRVQLYTVPGQVFYNETRKLVLKGADGIVFVADSQQQMLGANAESFKNLEDNLRGHAMSLADMPHVIQFNKRDLPKLAGIEEMNAAINRYNAPFYESVATTGIGVQDTLKAITKLVLLNLTKKYDPRSAAAMAAETALPATPPAPAAQTAQQAPIPTIAPTIAPAPVESPAPPIAAAQPTAEPAEIAPAAAGEGIPLSDVSPISDTPAFDVPAELPDPEPTPAAEPAAPPVETVFQEDEIDELVGEVEQAPDPAAPAIDQPPVDVAAEGLSAFEIDSSGLDFEEPTDAGPPPLDETPMEEATPISPMSPVFPVSPADESAELGIDPPPADTVSIEPSTIASWSPDAADGDAADAFSDEPQAPGVAPDIAAAAAVDSEAAPVTLTEVATDTDLFEDPTIEVARLAGGAEQEIVIPVELAQGRFRLSVKLRLDPIDS